MSAPRPTRCAIYTRKSNENGLEQEFNSLDAQREACEAYVKSQAHEGWTALPTRYDDGGFSGGSMERPALRRLLVDIAAGRVETIIVYKIDRLTRNLADFARMVDLFDRHEVTFVSVTQAFNTTNSMGRLTLNVLLSFAQFEREVTGERIRDKIAASKAKGLWMGGILPLGYDGPDDGTRILKVNESEATLVRLIFTRYLEMGSVCSLRDWLNDSNFKPKQWTARNGRKMGAARFNRVYRGLIRHKASIYPGGHPDIVDAELFDLVQRKLDHAARRLRSAPKPVTKAPLAGCIFDATGRLLTPTRSQGRGRRVYRYYTTKHEEPAPRSLHRVPGFAIEKQLRAILARLFPAFDGDPLDLVLRVKASYESGLTLRLLAGESASTDPAHPNSLRLEMPLHIRSRRGRTNVQLAQEPATCFDELMIGALRRAHALVQLDHQRLPRLEAAPATLYERRLIRMAFLAPDLQVAILEGRQPDHLKLEQFIERPIPIDWNEQRAIFQLESARSKLRNRSEASTLAFAEAVEV
jgi:DNA invertase Pin-like site-specific DNA recombinase